MEFSALLCLLSLAFGGSQQTLYDVSFSNLFEFPQSQVPGNTLFINISNNNISELGVNILERAPSVYRFDISRNQLKFVSALAFNGTELQVFWALYNQLTSIPDFSVVRDSLIYLHLASNSITQIGTLASLHRLRYLSLLRNQVETSDLEDFRNTLMLSDLILQHNRLESVEFFTGLMVPSGQLLKCDVHENPSTRICTCELADVMRRLPRLINLTGACIWSETLVVNQVSQLYELPDLCLGMSLYFLSTQIFCLVEQWAFIKPFISLLGRLVSHWALPLIQ